MTELPSYIRYYSETINKPVSSFVESDWREAAISAGRVLDGIRADYVIEPKPKPRGRPKKQEEPSNALRDIGNLSVRSVGRPRQTYGKAKVSAEVIVAVADKLHTGRWIVIDGEKAPRSKADATRLVLRAIGVIPSSDDSALRAARKVRAATKRGVAQVKLRKQLAN